ncbi:hypothetical protein V6N13_146423 [Hibiscus sabdariffa]
MKGFHYFKDKFRSKGQRSAPKSSFLAAPPLGISELEEAKAHNLRVFSFSELKQATRNFNRRLQIGEGGFGSVYKGTIKPPDGKGEPLVVAIKKLEFNSHQGQQEWLAEIHFLSVVKHPNVIKLIGHCAVDGERGIERLLVYEFMQNKSLADHLFNQAFPPLPWKTRLQIILGAAQALAYLHEWFQVQIIHRSFKPSDVLLDEKFNPKLSDFGLAREGPMAGDEHVSTRIMGTYGYAAPEYVATGHLSYKSEVWSFGVVLYEILSAREIAKLADACLSTRPQERPKMSEVVERLMHIIQVSEEGGTEKMESHPEGSVQDGDANELLAIKYALESFLKAERKGKTLLIVESDSATAVKWIEDVESRPSKLWYMLKEIDSLISQTGTVVFKILLKEANDIEDCLVKDGNVRFYKSCVWW